MIGQTVSHYKILSKLGEGGMGVVYKAEDLKLKRIVALKFLPPRVSASGDELVRFQQEAEAVSALSHPNIATIFDIDDVEGQKFLALEYIPGGTLKSRLKHLRSEDRDFSIGEALDFGIQAAEALAHAHRHQIIHRDVKTDNLMLTEEGKVKLTDFGLAKLRGSIHLTKTGTTVGTAAYMSPEQIRGEEVDHRSDIFSLGVVLYELMTSRLPFQGAFETAVSYSILNEEPSSPTTFRKDTPPGFERILQSCLQKDKTKRYQSADDVVNALRQLQSEVLRSVKREKKSQKPSLILGGGIVVAVMIVVAYLFWQGKPAASPEKSIAILPFVDMSPQKDQEYFCDGMTVELIDRLSNIASLKVPASTSVFALKGRAEDIRAIGRILGVDNVLEGDIRKSGNQIKITAQLIGVDGYHLWSQTYEREMKDVFAIQAEIALAIVDALRMRLNIQQQTNLTKHGTTDIGAFELYFKGKRLRYTERPKQMLQAKGYFEDAIKKDPNYAAAYAGLAENYMVLGLYSVLPCDEAGPMAKKTAERALAIDENSSEVHVSMGVVKMVFDWDWKGAEEELKKAIALNPGNFDAHREYGVLLCRTYRYDQAEQELIRSRDLDPLNALPVRDLRSLYRRQGREEKAREVETRLAELDPHWTIPYYHKSVEAAQKQVADNGRRPWDLAVLADAYHVSKNFEQEAMLLKELENLYERTKQGEVAFSLAYFSCATLHDTAKSLTWLERAADGRAPALINASVSPAFDFLQNEPRFQAVLKRVGVR